MRSRPAVGRTAGPWCTHSAWRVGACRFRFSTSPAHREAWRRLTGRRRRMMDSHMRALDLSCGVGAAYSSKLLAEFGWDVVKVEPPHGDPLRRTVSRWGGGVGGAFEFVNQGKRSVAGLSSAQLHELAAH